MVQVGFKHFFLVTNNKPGLEYVCCFRDETQTGAEDVVRKEFGSGQESEYVGCLGHEHVQCRCRMANARCLCFYKHTVLSVLRLRGYDGRGGAWECGADPPEMGIPGQLQACQCQRSLGFPWSSSTPTSILFLTNTIKLILSWKGAFKKLPFLLVERRVSNSFTSSPKTTAQTCGASRGHLVFKRSLEI